MGNTLDKFAAQPLFAAINFYLLNGISVKEQTVYIIDDEESIRAAVKLLLETVGVNAETFASAKEFLDVFTSDMSGCIVTDVRMARMSGLMLQKELNNIGCHLPLIFITGHADVEMAVQALKDGAFDFIQKPFRKDNLLECINKALEKNLEQQRLSLEKEQVQERLSSLTQRESEILDLLVEGMTSKQIANQLGISSRTVDVHRQNILHKLDANSVVSLISTVSSL